MGKTKFIDRLRLTGDLRDKAAIKYLRNLEITSKESYLWNYHVISRHTNQYLDEVAVELFDHDIQIKNQEYKEYLETTISDLYSNDQFISDDEAEIASRLIQGMLRIADKHSHSALGLIQSCRLFNLWMSKIRLEMPDEIRQEFLVEIDIAVYEKTIDFIISNVSFHEWVESALQEIRSLYRILHIVAGKSALEGNNRITRRIQKICGLYP